MSLDFEFNVWYVINKTIIKIIIHSNFHVITYIAHLKVKIKPCLIDFWLIGYILPFSCPPSLALFIYIKNSEWIKGEWWWY